MGHNQDFWETIRRKLARPIGAFLTGVKSVDLTPSQFVGYVEMEEEEFEKRMHKMGFERNPLSYWKRVPGVGEEEGSWRKTDGVWQLHVMFFQHEDHENRTYVYAHWEYRWDVHPIKHIRAVGQDHTKGVNEMRRELNLASINYYNDPSVR